jgi:hypothetical protein
MTSAAKKVDLIFLSMIPSFYFSSLHRYLPGAVTPAGRVVQNAVNGVVKEQKQPVAQAWVALHVPPHVVDFWAGFRS